MNYKRQISGSRLNDGVTDEQKRRLESGNGRAKGRDCMKYGSDGMAKNWRGA